MATCNDCIHNEVCKSQVPRTFWDSKDFCVGCEHFKDKSHFIELPCGVGDTVYVYNGLWISEYIVKQINYDGTFWLFYCENSKYSIENREYMFFSERIGKTVFFTYEEAEKALKECKNSERLD